MSVRPRSDAGVLPWSGRPRTNGLPDLASALPGLAGAVPIRVRHLKWQVHREDAALPLLASDFEAAAVLLHDLRRASEAEAGSLDRTLHVTPSVETLEDAWNILGRDADAFVANLKGGPLRRIVLLGTEHQCHSAAFRAELDRVGHQIRDDPFDPRAVPGARRAAGLRLDHEIVAIRRWLKLGCYLLGELHEVSILPIEQ